MFTPVHSIETGSLLFSKNRLRIIPLADSEYKYYGQQTKFLVSKSGGAFVDKTAEIKQNGYMGRIGEPTIIRIQMSGFKCKDDFKYVVVTAGQLNWGSTNLWWLNQKGEKFSPDPSPPFGGEFLDSNNQRMYTQGKSDTQTYELPANCFPKHGNPSSYKYTRQLTCYTSPKFVACKNGALINGTGALGDINQFTNSNILESQQAYNGVGYGPTNKKNSTLFWSYIAKSYDQLGDHSHNIPARNYINSFITGINGEIGADASTLSATSQWDTADTNAYSVLSYDKFNITDASKYNVYYDIDLSTMVSANSSYGEYAIKLDDGAVVSDPVKLSFFDVSSPLTIQQSAAAGAVATSSSTITIYNPSPQVMKTSLQPATAALGGNAINLVNTGFFTSSNVETFGSTTTMKNIEVTLNGNNINTASSLPDVPTGTTSTFTINLKNANAITSALIGEIIIPVTFTCGTSVTSTTLNVPLNSVVPQVTVSVPISINLNVAKDRSVSFTNGNQYYIENKSSFPIISQVSATLIQQDSTSKNEVGTAVFPVINPTTPFKIGIKSTKSPLVPFTSTDISIPPSDFRDFGQIGARNGKLDFNMVIEGNLPTVAVPGTYHYNIFFKFATSASDFA